MSRADEELLAAYLDGVSELDGDERKRVEQLLDSDPALRGEAEAMRGTLDKLRAMPHEGTEPDWNAMAHAIHKAVGPTAPRPWWRRWNWVVPIAALATTAAITMVWLQHSPRSPELAERHVAGAPNAPVVPAAPAGATTIWLDGEPLDIDGVEPSAFDDLDREAREALSAEGDGEKGTLLPATDLNWIDDLDDGALERAEHWLDRKKS